MAGPKKRPLPLESDIRDVYPRLNLREAGAYFGVGQTLFSKWLKYYGIERTKIHRVPTSDEARRNMSKAQKLGCLAAWLLGCLADSKLSETGGGVNGELGDWLI